MEMAVTAHRKKMIQKANLLHRPYHHLILEAIASKAMQQALSNTVPLKPVLLTQMRLWQFPLLHPPQAQATQQRSVAPRSLMRHTRI